MKFDRSTDYDSTAKRLAIIWSESHSVASDVCLPRRSRSSTGFGAQRDDGALRLETRGGWLLSAERSASVRGWTYTNVGCSM
jgi:hypothetical protein